MECGSTVMEGNGVWVESNGGSCVVPSEPVDSIGTLYSESVTIASLAVFSQPLSFNFDIVCV